MNETFIALIGALFVGGIGGYVIGVYSEWDAWDKKERIEKKKREWASLMGRIEKLEQRAKEKIPQ